MIRALCKTGDRTGRFLGGALAWRASDRQHAVVAWGLVAGAVWLATSLAGDPAWAGPVLVGLYLMTLLAAVCAIDARYGIIPNSPCCGACGWRGAADLSHRPCRGGGARN